MTLRHELRAPGVKAKKTKAGAKASAPITALNVVWTFHDGDRMAVPLDEYVRTHAQQMRALGRIEAEEAAKKAESDRQRRRASGHKKLHRRADQTREGSLRRARSGRAQVRRHQGACPPFQSGSEDHHVRSLAGEKSGIARLFRTSLHNMPPIGTHTTGALDGSGRCTRRRHCARAGAIDGLLHRTRGSDARGVEARHPPLDGASVARGRPTSSSATATSIPGRPSLIS